MKVLLVILYAINLVGAVFAARRGDSAYTILYCFFAALFHYWHEKIKGGDNE